MLPEESQLREWERESAENGGYLGGLTAGTVDQRLDGKSLIDALGADHQRLADEDTHEAAVHLIGSLGRLSLPSAQRLADVVLAAWDAEVQALRQDLEAAASETYETHRLVLEGGAGLLCWLVRQAEARHRAAAGETTGRGRGRAGPRTDAWDWPAQRLQAVRGVERVLGLGLGPVFPSAVQRDVFAGRLLRLLFGDLLESGDAAKQDACLAAVCGAAGHAARLFGLGEQIEKEVLLALRTHEHLADAMAQLVATLATAHDAPQVAEHVLQAVSAIKFGEKDGVSSVTRALARFLVRSSELIPHALLRQMVDLQVQVDAGAYVIRCAMLEVFGNLILRLAADAAAAAEAAADADAAANQHSQIDSLLNVLAERFYDVNAFVRSKLLQILARLFELRPKGLPVIPKARVLELVELALGRLRDKTVNVRRQAIKFLTIAVDTHPFSMDERKLRRSVLEAKRRELEMALRQLLPSDEALALFGDSAILGDTGAPETANEPEPPANAGMDQDNPFVETEDAQETTPENQTADEATKLQLIYQYYCDACAFARQVEAAVPLVTPLLGSTNKLEVMDAVDFVHLAHHYELEAADRGVRRMVHLVWSVDKPTAASAAADAGDEGSSTGGRGVRECLVETFGRLFIADRSARDAAARLIELTRTWNLAELTSLEALLGLMLTQDRLPAPVVDQLWAVLAASASDDAMANVEGAAMLLAMLARAKPAEIARRSGMLLRHALGAGRAVPAWRLAKFGCMAMQHLAQAQSQRFASDAPVVQQLCVLLTAVPPREALGAWVEMAEQAVQALYQIAKRPDEVCGAVLRQLSARALRTADGDPAPLTRLLLVVGHVAIKQVVHLEAVEREWKRRAAGAAANSAAAGADDLDAVQGSAEDEFADFLRAVRERELVYGPRSLLAAYAPLVVHVCANKQTYGDALLQRVAAAALARLMCVSGEFCEAQLPLFLTILAKTQDPAVQSNLVIALGDMAVCHNALVDRDIAFLYDQLANRDARVKRTALMVLCHLVLNGMVKTKGQLGEMAKCLADSDPSIADMARLFFSELAAKDHAVYHSLPDVISHLSAGSSRSAPVGEDAFRAIMRFLFEFVRRDRHSDAIVDKLCLRFAHASGPRQWRDIGFCLSLLPFSTERSVRRLQASLPHLAPFLGEDALYKSLVDVLAKAKKTPRAETRLLVEELERDLASLREASLSTMALEAVAHSATSGVVSVSVVEAA